MSQIIIGHEQTEAEILHFDVSDEELETAADTGKQRAGAQTIPFALICIPFERG
ncbi:MAG: hypothetical protein ACREB8_18135 [Pseudolabrys sp.]